MIIPEDISSFEQSTIKIFVKMKSRRSFLRLFVCVYTLIQEYKTKLHRLTVRRTIILTRNTLKNNNAS